MYFFDVRPKVRSWSRGIAGNGAGRKTLPLLVRVPTTA
jgi:hypothetical protein